MKKPAVDPNYCNNVVLRQAARRLGQLYDDVIEDSGLKATQQGLIAHVLYLDEPMVRELADSLVMDASALAHTLKPLIRDGLLELIPDSKDRRAKRVRVTAAGKKRFDAAMALWSGAHDSFEAVFGIEKATQLRESLSFIASSEFAQQFATQLGQRRKGRAERSK